MTDQEIIAKYAKEIEENIRNICHNRGISNAQKIKEFAAEYKSNFVQGFREEDIEIAKKMLCKQKAVEEIIELTELTHAQIEQIRSTL